MYSPQRRDFMSVTLIQPDGSGGYNNSKSWRRKSCWRKWKQLSRLQRSIILFLCTVLAVCGVVSFSNLGEHWKSLTSQIEGVNEGRDMPDINPAHPAVLPAPKEAEDPDGKLPKPAPLPQQKLRRPNKRGPPNLQPPPDKGQKLEDNEQRPDEADNNQPIISWRGAVIEPVQTLAPSPVKAQEPTRAPPQDVPEQKEPVPISERQEAVIEAFRHAWSGYKQFAWGHDELKPISKSYSEWFGLGLTLIDALDTMWILGLKEGDDPLRRCVIGAADRRANHSHGGAALGSGVSGRWGASIVVTPIAVSDFSSHSPPSRPLLADGEWKPSSLHPQAENQPRPNASLNDGGIQPRQCSDTVDIKSLHAPVEMSGFCAVK